jgi:hypothetical protein
MAGRAGRVISPAATSVLRLGYVHNIKGDMFLVHPRKDFWQSRTEGPGFYHQIGGENEKLPPGRIDRHKFS